MERRELDGLTVLVIDDHLDSLEIAEIVLERAGARVLAAPSAEAGLRFLDTQSIDVLVCDLSMPRVDGFDVVRAVRARKDDKRSLPAIAVSGSGAHDAGRAITAGFDAHATKPIAPEALVAHVRRLADRPAA
ncbi:response regulator [Sandaracinus amylolyticus]|uniref:response regulator n=1 Tax=Sandaracinus amylolyticus TaxID=927083 RepID=UPI001F016877|nr:response regulator [Sandaracinus amylolyticus]UJR79607.1 Two-component hybrid sensor and regulator [Sandaracinus amylolyticus]